MTLIREVCGGCWNETRSCTCAKGSSSDSAAEIAALSRGLNDMNECLVEQENHIRRLEKAIREAIQAVEGCESPGCTGCVDAAYSHKHSCSKTNAIEILRDAL